MSLGSEVSAEKVTRSVRRFRAASGAGLPFFPYGVFPVIGFFLLTLIAWSGFAHQSIENVVLRTAEQAIRDTGAEWASVNVSGQWGNRCGRAPDARSWRAAAQFHPHRASAHMARLRPTRHQGHGQLRRRFCPARSGVRLNGASFGRFRHAGIPVQALRRQADPGWPCTGHCNPRRGHRSCQQEPTATH